MPQPTAPRRQGFTLVELLVVIGIIALLISILLPSLNKAKKQANLVYCQSQLRQMFQAAVMYANENKGNLPYGRVTGVVDYSTEAVTAFNATTREWDWSDSLSIVMGKKPQATFAQLPVERSAIFRDLDTVDDAMASTNPWPYNAMPLRHYTANSRMFPVATRTDKATGKKFRQRKLSSIRQPATTMAIWDGGQQLGAVGADSMAGNSWSTSDNIDQNRTGFGHCLFYPAVDSWYGAAAYKNLLAIGTTLGNSVADVKAANVDATMSYTPINLMRFRHLKNDTGNFVFADGHAESRKVATVTVMDVCIKRD